MSNFKDLTGMKFGRLTVVSISGKGNNVIYWNCLCECGKSKIVRGNHLRFGETLSCGCWHKERASNASAVHLLSGSRTYHAWSNMKNRCDNPQNKGYHRYGGRGIKYDPKWRTFNGFLEDMGECPEMKEIDRVDNNGNYCKENCRWASNMEQMNNYSKNVVLSYKGKTQTATQWAREIRLSPTTLYARLRRGWSVEKTLSTPLCV